MDRDEKRKWRKDLKIAFDVDGTLISGTTPRYDVIAIMEWFIDRGYDVIIWSGGGFSYAYMWAEKLGFQDKVRVLSKDAGEEVDIAFDDQPCELGKVNIEV